QSPSTPSSPNLTQSSSSAPTLVHPSQSQASKTPSPPTRGAKPRRKWVPLARAFTLNIVVACIFVFVCLITNFGQSSDWLLARLTPTSGILLLSFLSKIIDWGLGGTTDKTWNMLQWGPILRGGNGREKNMLTFLTLGARLDGAIKVLFSRVAWSNSSPGTIKGLSWSRIVNCAGVWALLKFFVWILAQFPGLIIMAVVEPQTQYLADNFTRVSGGIGVFDPSTIMPTVQGPMIAQYVYRNLNDPRLSFQTDQAVTPGCQSNTSCTSYLLTGGIQTITPFPQQRASDPRLTAYIAKDVPSYQLETWDLSNTTAEFLFRDCEVYHANISGGPGFYFCMKDEPDGGILAAGYAPCYSFDGPGQCRTDYAPTLAIQLYIWITKIKFYRLKTSFIADRRTGSILSLLTSSNTNSPPSPADPPTFQNISIPFLRKALNAIICPQVTNQTSTPTFGATPAYEACDKMMPNFLLTDSIANLLSHVAALEYSPGLTILQNLFATVLMLFNPVWETQLGIDENVLSDPNGLVSGLPEENYFTGSMARPVEYVAPAGWTVIAFMVCGGLLLFLCAVGMVVS
ncbi:hypothetical protein QBC37DRAFT_251120, partial [Rhypophila decipiens]